MSTSIKITNPGQDPFYIDYNDFKCIKYLDPHKPDQLTVECSPEVPVKRLAEIELKTKGYIPFRGYVSQPPKYTIHRDRKNTLDLDCLSIESILNHRYSHAYVYPHFLSTSGSSNKLTLRLKYVVGSDAPLQTEIEARPGYLYSQYMVGVLFMANSSIPEGQWELYSSSPRIYKLPGGGTSSRIGASEIYVDGRQLTRCDSLSDLVDGYARAYSDLDDLYVNYFGINGVQHFNCYAENAFDSKIRLGNGISNAVLLTGPLNLDTSEIGPSIINVLEAYGYNVSFRHALDGYTYVDVSDSAGRGTIDEPVYIFSEDDLISITPFENSVMPVSAILGTGVGSNCFKNRYSAFDLSKRGFWTEEVVTLDDSFDDAGGTLVGAIDAEYASRLSEFIHEVVMKNNVQLMPGDYIKIARRPQSNIVERIKQLTYINDSILKFRLGIDEIDMIDIWDAERRVSSEFSAESQLVLGESPSMSDDITIGDKSIGWGSNPFSASFNITSDVSGNNGRVLLNLSTDYGGQDNVKAYVKLNIDGNTFHRYLSYDYVFPNSISDWDITDLCRFDGVNMTLQVWILTYNVWASPPTCNMTATVRAIGRIST